MLLHVPTCSYMFIQFLKFLQAPASSYMFLHVPTCSYNSYNSCMLVVCQQIIYKQLLIKNIIRHFIRRHFIRETFYRREILSERHFIRNIFYQRAILSEFHAVFHIKSPGTLDVKLLSLRYAPLSELYSSQRLK